MPTKAKPETVSANCKMTDKQTQIANSLLKYLADNDGDANTDQYSDLNNFNPIDISSVRDSLISFGLVEYRGTDKTKCQYYKCLSH